MRTVSKEYFSEHPRYIRLFAEFGVVILALVFLLLPEILRDNSLPIGDASYYHLSNAGSLSGVGPGWNFLLKYFHIDAILLVLGILSLIFFYMNLKKLNVEERLVALGFFIISPAFVYLFNVGERFGAGFLFSLVFFYLTFKNKYIPATAILALIFLFDYMIGLFSLFIFILYLLYLKGARKVFYFLIGLFILFTLIAGDFNDGIISDLGARTGSSIFALFFALLCFLFFWSSKKFLYLYGIASLLFLFSLKVDFGIFYFSLFLSLLMSVCFFELLRIKWESKLARDFILLIIICGLLFSGLSYVNRISKSKPDDNIFNALSRLPEDSVVFSDIEYGNWIQYSGKKAVWHSMMSKKELSTLRKDFSVLLESEDHAETINLLERYKVDYILVDQELREKWQESGLLYLLRYNSEDFRFLFDENGVEVWRFFR